MFLSLKIPESNILSTVSNIPSPGSPLLFAFSPLYIKGYI